MSFITRSGNQLRCDGKRYRFIGINNYPLITNSSPYSTSQLDSFFQYCVRDGISIVRCWCFDRTPYNGGGSGDVVGNFQYISGGVMYWREATFAQMDLVLDRAKANGVKLSLVMTNGANVSTNDGLKQSYCRWNNTINGTSYGAFNYGDSFHLDTNIKARFKAFLNAVYNRTNTVNGQVYKSDDTIAFIELINEGRFRNEGGSDTNGGTASSYFVTTLKSWYDEMASYLKSTIGVQQLVSTGSAGQYYDYVRGDPVHNNTPGYGLDYQLDHNSADIDYADFHFYPYSDVNYRMSSYGTKAIPSITNSCTMSASGTTITVTQTSHGYVVGEYIEVFDSNQSNYDGSVAVTGVTNANTFTYTSSSAPAQTTASGYTRKVTKQGLVATLSEYASVAHTTLNKPVIIGEYGLVKSNNFTLNPLNSYPKYDNHKDLFKIIFQDLDYDGIFLWHYTNLFDDPSFNIKPDGVHSGGNANSNLNDDDTKLISVISQYSSMISGKRIEVNDVKNISV